MNPCLDTEPTLSELGHAIEFYNKHDLNQRNPQAVIIYDV